MSTLSWSVNSNTNVVKEQQLNDMALELFREHECTMIPRFPWVMVRVLPRDQQFGSIILPGGKAQNKPVYEGIVLRTWQPFTIKKGQVLNKFQEGLPNNRDLDIASEMEMGDHICFEHWAGLPVPGLHENFYRMVPEFHSYTRDKGPIYGKLVYQQENSTEKLQHLLEKLCTKVLEYGSFAPSSYDRLMGYINADVLEAIGTVKEQFDIVRKVTVCKTISGR